MKQGDAVPIIVALGSFGLTVKSVPVLCQDLFICLGARIFVINMACTFYDKVSIGDITVSVHGIRGYFEQTKRELIIIPVSKVLAKGASIIISEREVLV